MRLILRTDPPLLILLGQGMQMNVPTCGNGDIDKWKSLSITKIRNKLVV